MSNPNKWLLEDSADGADAVATTEFVKEVVKEAIVSHMPGKNPPTDKEGKAKLGGMVDVEAMSRLTSMRDKADRAMVYHVTQVVHDGTHQYSPGEASSITEWLAEALDESEVNSSEWYDLSFIASELVPYMVANGVPNSAVLWASGYKRKARAAVPMMRHLFKKAPKNLPDRIKEITSWIVDPKVSKSDIEKAWAQAKGLTQIQAAYGTEQVVTGGNTVLTIKCDPVQLGAIKKKLKGLVDFHISGTKGATI